jgi:preprotein translocase subunit SecG
MTEKGVAYILGIVSIVMAFFQPLAGITFGIIGLVQNKKEKSVKSKKLNIIGIVLSIAWLIISIGITYYLAKNGLGNLPNFPA